VDHLQDDLWIKTRFSRSDQQHQQQPGGGYAQPGAPPPGAFGPPQPGYGVPPAQPRGQFPPPAGGGAPQPPRGGYRG